MSKGAVRSSNVSDRYNPDIHAAIEEIPLEVRRALKTTPEQLFTLFHQEIKDKPNRNPYTVIEETRVHLLQIASLPDDGPKPGVVRVKGEYVAPKRIGIGEGRYQFEEEDDQTPKARPQSRQSRRPGQQNRQAA